MSTSLRHIILQGNIYPKVAHHGVLLLGTVWLWASHSPSLRLCVRLGLSVRHPHYVVRPMPSLCCPSVRPSDALIVLSVRRPHYHLAYCCSAFLRTLRRQDISKVLSVSDWSVRAATLRSVVSVQCLV